VTVRKAIPSDLEEILSIVDYARGIMRSNGNPLQWPDGYPPREAFVGDIGSGKGYVCTQGDSIKGYFSYFLGEEPTYARIYGGQWLDDKSPYGTLHRIASAPSSHGILDTSIRFALSVCPNLRIDTHRDNSIMRNALSKRGFTLCGTILLSSGDERLAYQKILF